MITRKIARNGMRGRKKVSALLVLVLTCTFLFITAAILLETSMKETKLRQREQLYGTWQAAYFGADAAVRERFLSEPELSETAISYRIGKDKTCGTVSSLPWELADMGKLVVKQGRLPEAEGEIVIEESVADALGYDDPVGETVRLTMETILVSEDKDNYLMEKYIDYFKEHDFVGSPSASRRQIAKRERVSDTLELAVNSEYSSIQDAGEVTPEQIEENGLLYEQTLILMREYRITGVVQSFSGFWDTGAYETGSLFVSPSEAEALLKAVRENRLKDLSDFSFDANVYARSELAGENLFEALKDRYVPAEETAGRRMRAFRRNTYAYPQAEEDVERTLAVLIIVVIFVVAFCAVLQIFLTQMRQRTRRIALMKAVGMTNGQVCAMLFWEGVYLLCFSVPAGVLLGFAAGRGAVEVLNRAMGLELSFFVRPPLIGAGILAGCAALFAGMLLPLYKALKVPLTGTIAVTEGRKRRKALGCLRQKTESSGGTAEAVSAGGRGRRRMRTEADDVSCGSGEDGENGGLAEMLAGRKALTYPRIRRLYNRLDWKSRLLTEAIAGVSCLLVFLSLYLGYRSFFSYHEAVTEKKRPNYELNVLHGMERGELRRLCEALEEQNPEIRTQMYHQLNGIFLQYDGMEESPLLSDFGALLPPERRGEFVFSEPGVEEQMLSGADPEDYKDLYGSVATTLYTVDTNDEIYDQICSMVTEGEVDENAFLRGEQVILVVPLYKKGGESSGARERSVPDTVEDSQMFEYCMTEYGSYEFTYDRGRGAGFQKDTSVRPGNMLKLHKRQEYVSGGVPVPPSYETFTVRVAGIIYHTAGDAVYPFLAENQGMVLIGSDSFLGMVSRRAVKNPVKAGVDYSANEAQFSYLLSQCPTVYGQTHVNLYTGDGANAVESAAQCARIGKTYGMSFVNYNEENWNLYYRALNNALIAGILGGTSLVIALMILWNIRLSAFEQERRRIGVLQALGVSDGRIRADYVREGVVCALTSLFAAHFILAAAVALAQGGQMYLKYYPWVLHGVLVLLYFVLVTAIFAGPGKELKKYAPTENLRA